MTHLVLAPIRGVTTATFRSIYAQHFPHFDEALAPFIPTIAARKINRSHIKDILPENNANTIPLVPQLIGNNADDFLFMANSLYDQFRFSVINWNLGCPFATVVNKKRGSGLLPYPDRIDSFLDTVCATLKSSLSIKVRLGIQSDSDILKVIEVFNQYPLQEIIIHPRTAKQKYTGTVNLNQYQRCLELSKHPVVYSGDITEVQHIKALQKRFPQTIKWMLGRGVLRNPLLSLCVKNDCTVADLDNPIPAIAHFHDDLYQAYKELLCGPIQQLGRMKELWFYLSALFITGDTLLKKVRKCRKTETYEDLIDSFFHGLDSQALMMNERDHFPT